MVRVPCCDKNNGLKKGPWTPEEDVKLINYIQTHGPGKWRNLPKIAATRLPGRTDNEIKNYWNTHIKKRLLRSGIDPVTHAPRLDLLSMSSILRTVLGNPSLLNLHGLIGAQALMNPELLNLVATASLLASQNNPQQQQQLQYNGNCQTQNQEFSQFQTPTQSNNVDGFMGNLRCSSSLQNYSIPTYLDENIVLQQNQVEDLLGNDQVLVHQSVNNANKSIGYDSVLSSPNHMNNSSSTYVSSSTNEEEKDSYCSELFNFEIPENLDISDFL
ncbi:unnamed protein product [Lupinus luteus]|uniref:Uncharacterized protein n=1 Tax=Lupinus luteus TaxID=3873 RepID=A0AAV1Y4K4_LUPLU